MGGVVTIHELAAYPRLVHGFSTLELGSVDREHGLQTRTAFAQELGIDPDTLTAVGAIHGADVAAVDQPTPVVEDVDGLVTDRPGVSLFAAFADCHPVVVYDPVRNAIGLAHAGWRGTVAGVSRNLLAALTREFGSQPQEVLVGLGPGVCGRCYEVDPDVASRFPAATIKRRANGKFELDVGRANRLQLEEAGIPPDNIHESGLCTRETAWLPSHRRDHDGRRFGTIVALRG